MSPHEDRGAAMTRSLGRTARSHGVPDEGRALLLRAFTLAMEARRAQLDDDHHPVYLHPGRTPLILLRDAEVTSGVELATAALLETRDEALRVSGVRIRDEVGDSVADRIARAPRPGDEDLAEALVVRSVEDRLISLAEHLDHLRHLHVRARTPDWEDRLREVEAVWLPVAERTHARLATRYRHWVKVFRRRLS